MALAVGSPAIDRPTYFALQNTIIDRSVPANEDGTLGGIAIWLYSDATGVEIGSCYQPGNYYTRNYGSIPGTISSGSEQLITGLSIGFLAGDWIGIHGSTGNIELSTSGGGGISYKYGDYIPCSNATFSYLAGRAISLNGYSVAGGEVKDIAGVSIGVCSVAGALSIVKKLGGSVPGQSSVSSAVAMNRELQAISGGSSLVAVLLSLLIALSACSGGFSLVVGLLARLMTVQAIAAGLTSVAAGIAVQRGLLGASGGEGIATCTIKCSRKVGAGVAGMSAVSGTLEGSSGVKARSSIWVIT